MNTEKFYDGQKIITVGKYNAIYLTGHPRTLQNGTVYVHVLVAERKLKRYLKPEEVIHHIDENKQIMPSRQKLIDVINNTNTIKEAAQILEVPCDTLIRWKNKLNIVILPSGRIKCVELNQIFQNKRDAARCIFPHLNPSGCAHYILKACKENSIYKDYHWEILPQEAF